MKRKFWNWVKNDGELGIERTLCINGEISDETWYGDEVTPKLFKDELNAGEGNITVWINSPVEMCSQQHKSTICSVITKAVSRLRLTDWQHRQHL